MLGKMSGEFHGLLCAILPARTQYECARSATGHLQVSLGVFTKLRRATISFVMSVCMPACLSVRPSVCMEHLGFHYTDFHEILYLSIFFENLSRKLKFH
jgi:hypothetical protein